MTSLSPVPTSPQSPSHGGRLVPAPTGALALSGCTVTARARGGLARVVLEQRFDNPHDEPLSVTYRMPLPADAAVSGFSFVLGDRRIDGEVDKKDKARERFEQAVVDGHSAALLEQERPDLFTQEIGNIPPHTAVIARIVLDQPLRWLDEGRWEWRFPLASAPRYLGPAGMTEDAARVTLDVVDGALPVRAELALGIADVLTGARSPESPSHAIAIDAAPSDAAGERDTALTRVAFGDGGKAPLDRDVVVRWQVAAATPGVSLDVARPSSDAAHGGSAYGLLTVVPPLPTHRPAPVARDLVVLLDTSGSMGGMPLEQAKRVTSALIDSLGDQDQLEMVEFSSRPRRYRPRPISTTATEKRQALAWVAALQAGGATEMVQGILEATKTLRAGAQRQVVLITDGLIGFETEVVRALVRTLPASCRLHTVGVGSAVNRSLLGPAARAGRGVEIIIGLGEDPERACQRLLARTSTPMVVDLALEGSALRRAAPHRLPDLFAGAPARIAVELDPNGGELCVRGRAAHGTFEQRLVVPPTAPTGDDAPIALFARERVEDLELDVATGEGSSALDREIEHLGVTFQIATRLTSWVAISTEATVDPREPTRHETVPQALPFGMSAEGLGLRAMAMPMSASIGFGAGGPPPPAPGRARMAASMGPAGAPPPPAGMPRPAPHALRRSSPGQPPPAPAAMAPPPQGAPAPAEAKAKSEGAAPPAKEKGGVFDKLTQRVARFFDRDGEDAADREEVRAMELPAEGARDAEPAATEDALYDGPAFVRPFVGRVTLAKDDTLVIEIVIPEDADWDPSDIVAVLVDDEGVELTAELDLGRTTRAATLRVGTILRVVLRGAFTPNARFASLRLDAPTGGLTVELTA